MGFVSICQGNEMLRYGSKNLSEICECVNKNDPNSIFTDGSLFRKMGQGGYGVYSEALKICMAKSWLYAEHKNNILLLELKAILDAVIHLKNNKVAAKVHIFSDSEHALTLFQSLENGEIGLLSVDEIMLGELILKEIKTENLGIEVHMHKVKAHSGISGNEKANMLAKKVARDAPIIPSLKDPPHYFPATSSNSSDRRTKDAKAAAMKDQVYSFSASFSSCDLRRKRLYPNLIDL